MDFDFKFGEMSLFEREKLYNFVLKIKPKVILECGSGTVASTYVMMNSIEENSKIYSCDPERSPIFASEKVIFHPVKSNILINLMIGSEIYPNFIFFDGPEDPNVALSDFKRLDDYVNVGTYFSMHDWCTTTRKWDFVTSTKAALLKPYINSLDSWELIEELKGEEYKEGEESVGLCFYKKIK